MSANDIETGTDSRAREKSDCRTLSERSGDGGFYFTTTRVFDTIALVWSRRVWPLVYFCYSG